MDLLVEIKKIIEQLEKKGEEPTSYKVAQILNMPESTIYYYWRKIALQEQEDYLQKCLQDIYKEISSLMTKLQKIKLFLESRVIKTVTYEKNRLPVNRLPTSIIYSPTKHNNNNNNNKLNINNNKLNINNNKLNINNNNKESSNDAEEKEFEKA